MKAFMLRRKEDPSGISGTGDIAEGVVFENGKVVVGWRPEATLAKVPSITVFDSVEDMAKVHGHGGMTEIVWDETEERSG